MVVAAERAQLKWHGAGGADRTHSPAPFAVSSWACAEMQNVPGKPDARRHAGSNQPPSVSFMPARRPAPLRGPEAPAQH